jgi:hypothetical protein
MWIIKGDHHMRTLQSVVKLNLAQHGYKADRCPEGLRTTIRGENGIWPLVVLLNEDDRWLVCRAILPFAIPETLRRKVAMLITHINYLMIVGNFELDLSDGEVAFKTSLRLDSDELTDAMVSDLLGASFSTMDRHLPVFMALVFGGRSLQRCLKLTQQNTVSATTAEPKQLSGPHPSQN